jgi:tRNA 2-thiouridine synthesizing protein A
MNFDHELDTRGLMCPLPIIKAKVAIDKLQPGEVLKVVATDPGSVRDMEAFAKHTKNALLASHEEGSEYVYYLQKNGAKG